MNEMKIKVCGLRDGENMRQVAALGVEWIGMVFAESSPRCVTMVPTRAGIIPDRVPEGSVALPADAASAPTPKRVGVFVDEMAQNIITRVVNFRLDAVQLHGRETPTFIRNLRDTLTTASADGRAIAPGLQVWKAVGMGSPCEGGTDVNALCQPYQDCCDLLVFDTQCPSSGGSGRHFDWTALEGYKGPLPFLLSGGIGPADAEALRRFSHPLCIGIDLNSRFETAPAMKDVEALRRFIGELGRRQGQGAQDTKQ